MTAFTIETIHDGHYRVVSGALSVEVSGARWVRNEISATVKAFQDGHVLAVDTINLTRATLRAVRQGLETRAAIELADDTLIALNEEAMHHLPRMGANKEGENKLQGSRIEFDDVGRGRHQ